jgi:hypothetical protein
LKARTYYIIQFRRGNGPWVDDAYMQFAQLKRAVNYAATEWGKDWGDQYGYNWQGVKRRIVRVIEKRRVVKTYAAKLLTRPLKTLILAKQCSHSSKTSFGDVRRCK